MRIFIDMDGTLAKWNNVKFEDLYEEGYYRNLKPNVEILKETNELISKGEDVYILSCYLTDSLYALKEKKEWCKEHLPSLPEEKYVFVPYGENKAKFFNEKGLMPITKDDYLIDDYTKNLQEWKVLGGMGVKFYNGINHTKGTWKGLMIYDNVTQKNNNDLFNLILAEKLKKIDVSLIAEYKREYKCEYKGQYFKLKVDPKRLEMRDVLKTIYSKVRSQDPAVKDNDVRQLTSLYYERHYPTLSKCRDFEKLVNEIGYKTLDKMEYCIFLYENTPAISLEPDGIYFSLGYEELEKNSAINISYLEWYEGMIKTEDLLADPSVLAEKLIGGNNRENKELEQPEI